MLPVFHSNAHDVLVKVALTDQFVALSTYCRQIGRRGWFLILTDSLRRVLDEERVTVLDTDCGHHVQIRKYNGMRHITFDWLSEYGDGHLKGFRQHVMVPCEVFGRLLETGTPVTYLYRPHEAKAQLILLTSPTSSKPSTRIPLYAAHSAKPCETISTGTQIP